MSQIFLYPLYIEGCKMKNCLLLYHRADCNQFIVAFNVVCHSSIDNLQEDESRPDCLHHQGRFACSYILAGHFQLFHRHTDEDNIDDADAD